MAEELTDDEIAALRADYEGGVHSMEMLARRFRINPKALRAMAERLSFGPRPPIRPFQRRADGEDAPPPPTSPAGASDTLPSERAGGSAARRVKKSGAAKIEAAPKAKPRRPTLAAKSENAKRALLETTPRTKPPRQASAPLKPLDLAAAAQRIQSAAGQELCRIQTKLEAGEDVERHARALASLVKSLGDLSRLEETLGGRRDAERGDDGAWTLEDLNAEIERRVLGLQRSRIAPPPAE
jgi:hypothetical protein